MKQFSTAIKFEKPNIPCHNAAKADKSENAEYTETEIISGGRFGNPSDEYSNTEIIVEENDRLL